MIDKLGDDKGFRGAYAYHLAVRDKINELVEAVNKLESHKHKSFHGTPTEQSTTSEPICNSQNAKCEELPIIETNNLNFATGVALAEAIRDIKDLKQVIQECYIIVIQECEAYRPPTSPKATHTGNVFYELASKLKPYIEEK